MYHRRNVIINDDFVFLRGVHLVTIHGLTADELPLALFIMLHGLDLLGNVLGVHVVHDSAKWRDVIGSGLYASVNAIQQGNVAHSFFRKVPLHVMASHDVIAPQTGKVFRNDHVDPFGFDIRDHPLERWTVKICTAEAVINVGIIHGQPVLLHEFT